METLCKIVIMVLFTFTMGEDTDDIKEMIQDMNIRLYKAEDQLSEALNDLANTKHELAETKTKLMITEKDLATTNIALNELALTKTELAKTKTKLMTTEKDLATAIIALNELAKDQTETKTVLMNKDNELESEITRLRNPPYMHACGAHSDGLSIKSATIPYSTLLYSSTNKPGGGLDIASGVFTSSYPGSYTVTWSLIAGDDAGDNIVVIYLQHNGQNIEESEHFSEYTGPSGWVYEQGGRTMVLHLDQGDTLELHCQDCTAEIYKTTFCVSLTTPDSI